MATTLGTAIALVAGGLVALAAPATAASLAAAATVTAPVEYVGHSAGIARAVAVTNTGAQRITAVDVSTPSAAWTLVSCRPGPGTWTATRTATGCHWASRSGLAVRGHLSLSLTAGTRASGHDQSGAWKVTVASASGRTAARGSLAAHAYSIQLTRVATRTSPLSVGSTCPAPARSAKAGSSTALVICGVNHTTAAFTTSPTRSTQVGSFASGGTWTYAAVRAGRSAVLADKSGVLVTSASGAGKTVIVSLHSTGQTQTSPQVTFGSFTATDHAPTAPAASASTAEDTPGAVALTGSDVDGDPTVFAIVTPPVHGTLGAIPSPVCTGSAPRVCTSPVPYTPTANYNGPDSFRYRVSDPYGGTVQAIATITVTPVNDAPTDIALSQTSVAENQPVGSPVGTLSDTDVDSGDGATYTLVSGAGSTDNASFAITGTSLQTAVVLDHEATPTASIRVRVTDTAGDSFEKAFTLTITNADEAPTDLALSATSVAEHQPSGTTVGSLSTTDPDAGDTFTYALVSGAGSGDNASFTISGSVLQTAAAFDVGVKSSYAIRVRSTDAGGLSVEKALTITVTNVNDPPTAPALSATTISENQSSGTAVGTLSATDPDGDPLTYAIVPGGDAAQFQLSGTTLQSAASFDFETKSSYSVTVQASDGNGGVTSTTFTITVLDANDFPTDLTLSSAAVSENQPSGTVVGALSDTDQDTTDTPTFSLVPGTGATDNGSFQVAGTLLETAASFDFETKTSYAIRLGVDDGHGGTFEKAYTVTVLDLNEAPTDITLSGSSFVEHAPAGTIVGTLTTADPDTADTFSYALVSGTGSTDNRSFTTTSDKLQVVSDLAAGSYSVRVRTTDSGSLFREKAFTVTVDVANHAPTDIALSNASVDENQPTGALVGTLSDTDVDAGDSPTYSVTGGADAALFTVSGTSLKTTGPLDFEQQATYAVTITVNDGHSGTFSKSFTITANDLNDAPTDLALSSSSIAENQPSGATVGTLSSTDQDAGDAFTYTLVAGTGDDDNASFTISSGTLQTNASFNFETKSSYTIRVRTTDSGNLHVEKSFTINVTDVNEPPTNVTLTPSSVAENQVSGATVGALSTTDPEGGSFSYALVSGGGGADNGSFTISGSTLKTAASFDFETKSSYAIRVQTTDTGGLTFAQALTVTVTNVNESPTGLALTPSTVAENQAPGTTVGALTSTDPDAGDTFSYALIDTATFPDNGAFAISGSNLQTAASFDFEAKSSYSIRVQTTDAGGKTFVTTLPVTVTNVNEAPTDLALDTSSVPENQPSGSSVGTLSTTDPDAGGSHTYTLVAGTGATDNTSFTTAGSTLKTTASFDFEAKNSYSIRVRSTDGGGLFVEKALTISVTDVNEAPTPATDAYSAIGNTKLAVGVLGAAGPVKSVAGSVLDNDTDPEHDALTVTFPTSSTHGSILTGNADGSFVYLPAAGFTGSDTFSYTVSDGALSSSGTVNITVSSPVWYADDSAPAGGTGQSTQPFNTATSLTASSAGQTLFLYAGTYSGGLTLKATQTLLTERAGLIVGGITLVPASSGATETLAGGLVLASGNAVQGLDLGNTTGYAISGTDVGTTVFDTTTAGLINNATGGAVGIASTGVLTNALNMTFTSVTSSSSSASGVSIAGASGTFTAGSGSSITNATGPDVLLSGGTMTFTHNGTITDDLGQLVTVTGKTSGSVSFTGFIDDGGDGDGSGISLTSNGTTTFAFTGGMRLSTGANPAFTATGGGTVTATQDNSAVINTLATTTGTALNVANTTIGAAGLTFRSIASSGAPSGIVLAGTGSGGLTVTGNGSGGTGGTITASTGPGLNLSGTGAVSLSWLNVTNSQDDGIRAATVSGLSLTSTSISGNGNAAGEDGLDLTAVTGTVALTSTTVSGSFDRNVSLVNDSGSTTMTLLNGAISGTNATSGDDGLFVDGTGTGTLSLTVTGTTFTDNRGDHIQMTTDASNTVIESLTVTGATMTTTSGSALGGGITFNPGGNATATASITGSTITGAVSSAITVATPGSATDPQPVTVNATISGNTIGAVATADSGSAQGDGISVFSHGLAAIHATITNNTIRQYSNTSGIDLLQNDGNGSLDAKVQSNTVSNPGSFATNGVFVRSGLTGGTETGTTCLDLGSATAGLMNSVTGSGGGGSTDLRVRQLSNTTVKLVGYSGSTTDTAAVNGYLITRNSGNGAPTASSTATGTGGGFVTAASCVVP